VPEAHYGAVWSTCEKISAKTCQAFIDALFPCAIEARSGPCRARSLADEPRSAGNDRFNRLSIVYWNRLSSWRPSRGSDPFVLGTVLN